MKKYLKTGFAWDNDGFLINQYAHLYHGSLYYNAAQSNGLDFWESSIFPSAGSLMWKLFKENQELSYNDKIKMPLT